MDLQQLVDEIARVLGAPATIEDRAFQLLAYCAQSGAIDRVREESILRRRASARVRAYFEGFGIVTAQGPVRVPPDAGLGVLGRVCVPLRHRGVTYGYLWLLDSGEIGDQRLAAAAPLIGRAAAALAQEAHGRREAGEGLRELLSPDPDVRAGSTAVVEGPVTAIAARAGDVAALWTLPRGVLADPGEPGETPTALLCPAGRAAEVARDVQGMYGTPVGVGGPRLDPGEAWESWREAVLALRVASAVHRHAPVAAWPELGVYRVLVRLPRRELADLAGRVRDLPEELAGTVETYLDHGCHATRTARELAIHRQTLYYRLGRAERLTGLRLDDGEDRLMLHLALKAVPLARHTRDDAPAGVRGRGSGGVPGGMPGGGSGGAARAGQAAQRASRASS